MRDLEDTDFQEHVVEFIRSAPLQNRWDNSVDFEYKHGECVGCCVVCVEFYSECNAVTRWEGNLVGVESTNIESV